METKKLQWLVISLLSGLVLFWPNAYLAAKIGDSTLLALVSGAVPFLSAALILFPSLWPKTSVVPSRSTRGD